MRHLRQSTERQEFDRVGMTSARDGRRHPLVEFDRPLARSLGHTRPAALPEVVDDVARSDDEDALRSQRPQPATELVVERRRPTVIDTELQHWNVRSRKHVLERQPRTVIESPIRITLHACPPLQRALDFSRNSGMSGRRVCELVDRSRKADDVIVHRWRRARRHERRALREPVRRDRQDRCRARQCLSDACPLCRPDIRLDDAERRAVTHKHDRQRICLRQFLEKAECRLQWCGFLKGHRRSASTKRPQRGQHGSPVLLHG